MGGDVYIDINHILCIRILFITWLEQRRGELNEFTWMNQLDYEELSQRQVTFTGTDKWQQLAGTGTDFSIYVPKIYLALALYDNFGKATTKSMKLLKRMSFFCFS